MQTENLKNNKNSLHLTLLSTFFLFLFVSPLSALAQDPDSIATLRQMGKAFASIAEKASPAVVSLRAERTVTRREAVSGAGAEWPRNPLT